MHFRNKMKKSQINSLRIAFSFFLIYHHSMDIQIEINWKNKLKTAFESRDFQEITQFVKQELKEGKTIFPMPQNIFAAFDLCPFPNVKVVILGQDPYHSWSVVDGKVVPTAHGLCFSVTKGSPIPPSLKNIYAELLTDLGSHNFSIPMHGDLSHWAQQGVLLLNSTLTVEAHKPMSHAGKGWEFFTDEAIRVISRDREQVVFLLWGRHAQAKRSLIDEKKHLILQAPHPSPLSAYNGFFGCRHFSLTNDYLQKQKKPIIDWQL